MLIITILSVLLSISVASEKIALMHKKVDNDGLIGLERGMKGKTGI